MGASFGPDYALYVVGGSKDGEDMLATMERLDLRTREVRREGGGGVEIGWKRASGVHLSVAHLSVAHLTVAHSYASAQFERLPDMPPANAYGQKGRGYLDACFGVDGNLYVIGGIKPGLGFDPAAHVMCVKYLCPLLQPSLVASLSHTPSLIGAMILRLVGGATRSQCSTLHVQI
jgi:hypothetical protein